MKIRGLILLLIVIVWLIGYFGPKENDEYRKIGWNEIEKPELKYINGNWKRGKVEEIEWKDGFQFLQSNVENTDTLMKVTFRTERDSELGPIVFYIHPATKEVVGHQARK